MYGVGAEAEERGAGGDKAEGARAAGSAGGAKKDARRSAAAVYAGHCVLETVGEEVACLLKQNRGVGVLLELQLELTELLDEVLVGREGNAGGERGTVARFVEQA